MWRVGRGGDDFARAYDEQVSHVYGFFAYRVNSRADAEDLTQATFERALRAWSRYDAGRAALRTWLLAIARNLLVDHYRNDRSASVEPLDESEAVAKLGGDDPGVNDLGIAPELERALKRLGGREREVIALRFGGELTGPEIADITGLTLANVHQILSRSLRRIRRELSREPVS